MSSTSKVDTQCHNLQLFAALTELLLYERHLQTRSISLAVLCYHANNPMKRATYSMDIHKGHIECDGRVPAARTLLRKQ